MAWHDCQEVLIITTTNNNKHNVITISKKPRVSASTESQVRRCQEVLIRPLGGSAAVGAPAQAGQASRHVYMRMAYYIVVYYIILPYVIRYCITVYDVVSYYTLLYSALLYSMYAHLYMLHTMCVCISHVNT